MINAAELRNYQESHRKTQIENELLSLEEKFKEAARTGMYCTRCLILHQENIDTLKKIGYRVLTNRTHFNLRDLYIICWGES